MSGNEDLDYLTEILFIVLEQNAFENLPCRLRLGGCITSHYADDGIQWELFL